MLVTPEVAAEGGMATERMLMPGDVPITGDTGGAFVVDETAGGVTLTQAQFAQALTPGLEVSGNAGAVATTLPSAQQVVDAVRGAAGIIVPPANSPYDSAHDGAPPLQWPSFAPASPQQAFRWVVRNLNAGTNTITAPASVGITLTGTATIATNKWREYIVIIKCGGSTKILGCTTTNANPTINTTDTETLKNIMIGQSVFGTNIAAGATVVGVDYNKGNIVLSANCTGTSATPLAITFTPSVTFQNFRAGDV